MDPFSVPRKYAHASLSFRTFPKTTLLNRILNDKDHGMKFVKNSIARKAVEDFEDRKLLGEPLFNPRKADKHAKSPGGLADLIKKSVYRSDDEHRATLWGGVLLVGGGSALDGTPERLEEDLFIISPDKADVAVTASPGRGVMTWQGGAYLTTLPEFENNWIHVEDREDPDLFDQRLDDTSYKV